MHVPDGFLDAPTSLATGAVAAVGVALALRGARRELDDRTAPMAGLVATFVFAGQMMNFPVGAGTSGHLLGGALAAVLVGPWTAVLCVSVVLLVQALFMADGGITALGTNITLMALVGVGVGWLVFVVVRAVLPKRLGARSAPAAAVAAFVSVPVAAVAFTPAVRGRRHRPRRHSAPCSPRWSAGTCHRHRRGGHHRAGGGQRGRRTPRSRVRRPPGAASARARDPRAGGRSRRETGDAAAEPQAFFATFLLVALLVAGVGSYYASAHPDGLEFVAEQDRLQRPGRGARRTPTARWPATPPRASTTPGSAAAWPAWSAACSCWCSPAGSCGPAAAVRPRTP